MEDAILVGLDLGKDSHIKESMLELANLAEACEVNVLHTVVQKRDAPTPNYYIGEGKLNEIKDMINTLDANLVIFNDELSPSHIRNLENKLEIKVIDRTVLILDIFAKRAKTKEAMLQVELAQAKYFMPRVVGMYKYLSRQKSGTGSKGPGEQQLELDRRLLRDKITKLKKDLKEMVTVRRTQRERRKKNNIPTVALTGYTNSGKSTLMNAIIEMSSTETEKYVFEKNMLFATLETQTRNIHLQNNHHFLLTDTVGFIDRLPHQLVDAFKSTLEEISEASLILHVIDLSNQDFEEQIHVVESVLKEIGVHDIPVIYVGNKIDLLKDGQHLQRSPSINISALNNQHIDRLLEMIDQSLNKTITEVTLLIPFISSEIYSELKTNSNVLETEYKEDGIHVTAELDKEHYNKYIRYIK